jgi:hypothetical protein
MVNPQRPRYRHLGVVSGEHKFIHATPNKDSGRAVVEEYIDYSARLAVVDVERVISTLDM